MPHLRIDSITSPEWMVKRFDVTPEGYLKGRAIATSIGVFSYQNADGTIRRELRLPDIVFSPFTLDSMRDKPLTNDHPPVLVTADNAKELSVGYINNPSFYTDGYATDFPDTMANNEWTSNGHDNIHCAVDIVVTDAETVKLVQAGKQALSMGYTCDLDMVSGVWCGVAYDAIQRNIQYNHCAIVEVGRAGDNAYMKLDSNTAISIGRQTQQYRKTTDSVENNIQEKTNMDLKKYTVDGIEYQADEAVAKAHVAGLKKIDELEADIITLKGELETALNDAKATQDSLKESLATAETALEEAKEATSDSALNALVLSKLELMKNADSAGVTIKADASDLDIKKAVILSVLPSAKLDGKDATYINAQYDAASLLIADKGVAAQRQQLSGATSTPSNTDSLDSTARRDAMIARMKNKEGDK